MKQLIFIIFSFTMLMGARCGQAPSPTPDSIDDTEFCDEAEAKLIELDCLDDLGFTNGKIFDAVLEEDITFTEFCVSRQEAGTRVFPKCLAKIYSCAELEDCSK